MKETAAAVRAGWMSQPIIQLYIWLHYFGEVKQTEENKLPYRFRGWAAQNLRKQDRLQGTLLIGRYRSALSEDISQCSRQGEAACRIKLVLRATGQEDAPASIWQMLSNCQFLKPRPDTMSRGTMTRRDAPAYSCGLGRSLAMGKEFHICLRIKRAGARCSG